MKIAVIGAGRVGRALGTGWQKAGHDVVYGVRAPEAADETGIADAVPGAAVIVLTVPWDAVDDVINAMGDVSGKIVIDCTNPVIMGGGPPRRAGDHPLSGGEQVAEKLPRAHVFKSLNQTGFETMRAPQAYPQKPVMFVGGDDATAKKVVLGLVSDLGLQAVDAGPLANAGLLEALAHLWIDLAFKRGLGRQFAFTLTQPKN